MSMIAMRGRKANGAGFSLIEVMVAVVILATGLLALAALQGALARNSADAKARSAIMAALTSRISDLRQAPPADGTQTVVCAGGNWVCALETQASVGGLTVSEATSTLVWKGSPGAFSAFANGDDLTRANFKRIALNASWNDAAGALRTLALQSDVSGKIYGPGQGYPVPDPTGSAAKKPILRQLDPGLEAGVIPIAYGSGQDAASTAASNPKPVLLGQSTVVGTQFDVLTYVPESGSVAVIRRRVDTNLIKCRCTTGLAAKDRYSVAGVAQWPTVWDGDGYETYVPSDKSLPPGEALKAGENPAFAGKNRAQSELCTECCRDHHDEAGMAVRFSPEGTVSRYDLNGSGVLSVSSSGNFVAACRVIRDNGFYKTASDMYLRQFGLLATRSDPVDSLAASDRAKDGRPTGTATTNYGNFVKKYLEGYLTSISTKGEAPTTAALAQQAFNDYLTGALNTPTNVEIPAKSATDERYLHSRGLYSDYLTAAARTKIGKAVDTCASANKLDCLLPHLPFTTINMTELAKWTSSDDKLNVIPAGVLLGTNVLQPFGGRTTGIKETAQSYARVYSSLSNSTLAYRTDIPFVNADEANSANWLADEQQFTVGATGGPSLPYITVVPNGLLTESALTRVGVTLNATIGPPSSCTPGTSDYRCDTAAGNLPGTVGLTISNYNVRETVTGLPPANVVCKTNTYTLGRPFQVTYSGISVSLTSGGPSTGTVTYSPATSRSISQKATWSSATRNDRDSLYVSFIGGEKQCPTTALCNGPNFKEWGTTYSKEACEIVTYTGL